MPITVLPHQLAISPAGLCNLPGRGICTAVETEVSLSGLCGTARAGNCTAALTCPLSSRAVKVAMFLSSGDPDMYEGAKFSFDGDFLGYLGLEDKGMFTCAGTVTEAVLDEIRKMAASL